MAILYSLVARGKVVLAEFTSTSGNFPTVVRFMLSVGACACACAEVSARV
jgi:hypothetical protein